MMRFGNGPVDIDPLIRGAETVALIASRLMVGTGSAEPSSSPLAIEKLEWDSPIFNEIYGQLSSFGRSILGTAGLVVAFGEHAIGSDHSGTHPISGSPLGLTGRFERVSSVFLEEPVRIGGDYQTNVVPAMEFTVTGFPTGHEGGSSDGTVLRFPKVSLPLLGQRPEVYAYVQAS